MLYEVITHVTSCLYHVNKNIEVILPHRVEMQVLSSQYKLTKVLPQDLGAVVNMSTIPYGLAVDIGTTTIVFYVVNLLFGSVVDIISIVNPQSKYGADVISRITSYNVCYTKLLRTVYANCVCKYRLYDRNCCRELCLVCFRVYTLAEPCVCTEVFRSKRANTSRIHGETIRTIYPKS